MMPAAGGRFKQPRPRRPRSGLAHAARGEAGVQLRVVRFRPDARRLLHPHWAGPARRPAPRPAQRAPRALDAKDTTRWLRTVERWLSLRDRIIALLPFYAGLRLGETVAALDLADVQLPARKGLITVRAADQRFSPPITGFGRTPAGPVLGDHAHREKSRGDVSCSVAVP